MRELQVHQSGRVAYTGSNKGGKYYAFWICRQKKWLMAVSFLEKRRKLLTKKRKKESFSMNSIYFAPIFYNKGSKISTRKPFWINFNNCALNLHFLSKYFLFLHYFSSFFAYYGCPASFFEDFWPSPQPLQYHIYTWRFTAFFLYRKVIGKLLYITVGKRSVNSKSINPIFALKFLWKKCKNFRQSSQNSDF